VIKVHRLIKRFGIKTVLSNLEFEVKEGEFVALMGPNGAGKTTFLRILSSLCNPTSGLVSLAGYQLPGQAAEIRSRLGVISHLPLLYGDLTAQENLQFFGRLYHIPGLNDRIQDVLDFTGLSSRRDDLVRTYSRGMQQRLAIARAILHNPIILLLDEPHTGLDQDACDMLDHLLRDVSRQGRTIVMTTHDLARVEDLASRFDVIARGRISASIARSSLPENGLLQFYRSALEAG
jgi:heme exporter protein A